VAAVSEVGISPDLIKMGGRNCDTLFANGSLGSPTRPLAVGTVGIDSMKDGPAQHAYHNQSKQGRAAWRMRLHSTHPQLHKHHNLAKRTTGNGLWRLGVMRYEIVGNQAQPIQMKTAEQRQ